MQERIIKVYNIESKPLINMIFDKQNNAKMMRTFKNLREIDFNCLT